MGSKSREYFTREEAEALVGKRIRTLIAWSGVPIHTTGRVISADENGDGWTVAIRWDLPIKPQQEGFEESAGEPFLVVSGGKPLVDWFSKSEYQQHLMEINEEVESNAWMQRTKEMHLGEIGIDAYAQVEIVPSRQPSQPEEFRLIIKKPSGQKEVGLREEDLTINFHSYLVRD